MIFCRFHYYGSENFKTLLLSQFSTDSTIFHDKYPDDDGIMVFKVFGDLTIIKKKYGTFSLHRSTWARKFKTLLLQFSSDFNQTTLLYIPW